MKVERRTFLRNMFTGLGVASIIGLFSSTTKAKSIEKIKSSTELNIETLENYLQVVFTQEMTLKSRRCFEVDIKAVKEVACRVGAVLSFHIKDFRIINARNLKGYWQVRYEATILFPASDKVWVDKYQSTFPFLVMGGPGDPVWISEWHSHCVQLAEEGTKIVLES